MPINEIDNQIDNQIDNIIQLNIEKIKNMVTQGVFEPFQVFQNISGENAADYFGLSIDYAKENNLITVGVPYYDQINFNAGAVFIYTGNPQDGWNYNNKILGSGIIDYLGSRVSTNKDGSVIVTNCQAGVGTNQKNEVHVYTGNTNDGWNLHQILTGVVNYSAGDWLKISNDAEIILVSDIGDNDSRGAVFVYRRNNSNGNWEFLQKLVGSNASDFFGYSIDISDVLNSVIVVGAIGDDAGGNNAGAGFIYSRIPGINPTWNLRQKITGLNSMDRFGESVALNTNGTVVVIGGNYYDANGLVNAGGAVVYTGLAPFAANLPSRWFYKQTIFGDTENGNFGKVVKVNSNGNIITLLGNNAFILYSGQKSNFPYAFPNGWALTQKITGNNIVYGNLELNSDGNIIVSTNPYNNGNQGNIFIYKSI